MAQLRFLSVARAISLDWLQGLRMTNSSPLLFDYLLQHGLTVLSPLSPLACYHYCPAFSGMLQNIFEDESAAQLIPDTQ